ncbi:hypothetical protein PSPO01_09400 [Paraphaeosphaeria sporulosa]
MFFVNYISYSAILSILLLLPWKIGAATTCGAADISSSSVKNCDCLTATPGTDCTTSFEDRSCKVTFPPILNQCNTGCIQRNLECSACYIYSVRLCGCVKGTIPGCLNNGDWWLLRGNDLITTTKHIPGILQLGSDNDGWQMGQTQLAKGVKVAAGLATRETGALAVNSVLVRSEEQIHIHVCYLKTSKFRDYLSSQVPSKFTQLSPLQTHFTDYPTVQCIASQKKGDSSMDVARITAGYLIGKTCDKYSVGAGLIIDKNDISWVCMTTTGKGSAEGLFCGT